MYTALYNETHEGHHDFRSRVKKIIVYAILTRLHYELSDSGVVAGLLTEVAEADELSGDDSSLQACLRSTLKVMINQVALQVRDPTFNFPISSLLPNWSPPISAFSLDH